jgi:hypothetical protein
MDLNETKVEAITLDTLREMVRSPAASNEHVESCVREFVAALPETMEDAFKNPPAGTKAAAVLDAVRHTHEIILTTIAAAFLGEGSTTEKERVSSVRELTDTLEGPDFDPDFKEPTPR